MSPKKSSQLFYIINKTNSKMIYSIFFCFSKWKRVFFNFPLFYAPHRPEFTKYLPFKRWRGGTIIPKNYFTVVFKTMGLICWNKYTIPLKNPFLFTPHGHQSLTFKYEITLLILVVMNTLYSSLGHLHQRCGQIFRAGRYFRDEKGRSYLIPRVSW